MIKIVREYTAGQLKRNMPQTQLQNVRAIVEDVRLRGDEALFEYTAKFDGYCLTGQNIKLSAEEIERGARQVPRELRQAIAKSAANVRAFHEQQKQRTWLDVQPGRTLGQLVRPIESCGAYVPGGSAAYPSSVLMNVIPAKVAGVSRIVMATPPGKDGAILPMVLAAAQEAGVDEIYRMGGAQAVAALAFGTGSIQKVDKITGPGNIYVALAKREVFGYVGIDMIAGPSEVLVIADESANPAFVAADLLSQAEHDPMAGCFLVTTSDALAKSVQGEIETQLAKLSRKDIARRSIDDYGAIIIAKDIDEACDISNDVAPEHLEILLGNEMDCLGRVKNAGAIFLGGYSPEPLGDYFAGPNHVLPTNGTARFFSPLSVDDFIKKSSIIRYSREELGKCRAEVESFATTEGLTAHAAAIAVRFEGEGT